MNETSLKKSLSKLKFGGLRYFDSIGSTNDEALAWAAEGAADFSLVVADDQKQGRGRYLSRTVGLAALSIAESCSKTGLDPRIKWPNDILIDGKKIAGILVETVWSGDELDSLVIGVGINVHRASIPPRELLQFPATSLEHELGRELKREDILFGVLDSLVRWRERMGRDEFIKAWEDQLAFRGQQVQTFAGTDIPVMGELLGLELDGSLRLLDKHRNSVVVRFGDVSLRPSA